MCQCGCRLRRGAIGFPGYRGLANTKKKNCRDKPQASYDLTVGKLRKIKQTATTRKVIGLKQ